MKQAKNAVGTIANRCSGKDGALASLSLEEYFVSPKEPLVSNNASRHAREFYRNFRIFLTESARKKPLVKR